MARAAPRQSNADLRLLVGVQFEMQRVLDFGLRTLAAGEQEKGQNSHRNCGPRNAQSWPCPFITLPCKNHGGSGFRISFTRRKTLLGRPLAGNFYAVFPHGLLAWTFGLVFVFACVALAIGATRFHRDISRGRATLPALAEASTSALTLRYLGGGHGQGCNDEDDAFTLRRRRFHHLTFYGFLLCFAATCVATLYHYLLAREAPYPWWDLPVVLGTLGGVGLLIGPLGLLAERWKRDPALVDEKRAGMDVAFIAMLFLTGLTGMALLVWRDAAAMGPLLALRLWGTSVRALRRALGPAFLLMAAGYLLFAGAPLLASVTRTRAQLGAFSTLIILTMSALGGSMFPRFLMPDAMRKVGLFTFNSWAIDGYTKVFWRDEPVGHLGPQVAVLVASGLVLFMMARWFARRWETA